MKATIEKMRADFVLVGEDRIQSGQWTEQDYAEVGAAIKDAISTYQAAKKALATQPGNDDVEPYSAAAVLSWARWLADLSAWVTAYRMICEPVNRLIELKLAERRAAESQGAAGQQNPAPKPAGPSRSPKHTGA